MGDKAHTSRTLDVLMTQSGQTAKGAASYREDEAGSGRLSRERPRPLHHAERDCPARTTALHRHSEFLFAPMFVADLLPLPEPAAEIATSFMGEGFMGEGSEEAPALDERYSQLGGHGSRRGSHRTNDVVHKKESDVRAGDPVRCEQIAASTTSSKLIFVCGVQTAFIWRFPS
jgi:hypothetical protein